MMHDAILSPPSFNYIGCRVIATYTVSGPGLTEAGKNLVRRCNEALREAGEGVRGGGSGASGSGSGSGSGGGGGGGGGSRQQGSQQRKRRQRGASTRQSWNL